MYQLSDWTMRYPGQRYNPVLAGVVNMLQWLLVAFILALVFRAFEMEAFQIPTGSMAETLRGAHYHLRCIRCGYKYDVGGDSNDVPETKCPSCGYVKPDGVQVTVSDGDRVVVLKCVYQFFRPERWDVVVFKNPLNPQDNFIKRLVAGPGETVQLIDGDVYINGRMVRKPPKVQEELWMPVCDNDYFPAGKWLGEQAGTSQVSRWRRPFVNEPNNLWNLEADGPTVFSLDSPQDSINTFVYDSSAGNDFKAWYGYNDSRGHYGMPICSDLMVKFHVSNPDGRGIAGASLSKYGIIYRGIVDFGGMMMIEKISEGRGDQLVSKQSDKPVDNAGAVFRFANVDHQLILEFGDNRLKYDLGTKTTDAGQINTHSMPEVKIFGAGKLVLIHLGIFKDVHYINGSARLETEENSFTLGDGEYFVCGDNSPISQDSREWQGEGTGNNGKRYRSGVVPQDYFVGKAFFVYWSEAFRPAGNLMPVIPNVGRIGLIHGGSDRQL